MLLLKQLMDLAYDCIDAVWSWVRQMFNAYGIVIVGLLTIMFVIEALGRYILRPFIGSAASDVARKKGKKDANNS